MKPPKESSSPPQTGPTWWVRDILIAGIVGIIVGGTTSYWTVVAQQRIDDARADRELRAANLTFVRERSSTDPLLPRPFTWLDLRDQYLGGLDLRNADFYGADLSGASLNGADLAGSSMHNVNLSGAFIRGATLASARMGSADLHGAVLREADLSGANFFRADLSNADLYQADLSDAELIGASLVGADLRGANMSGTDLRDADLTGVCWEHPNPLPTPPEWKLPDAQWPHGFTPPPSTDASCKPG
ncbi:pentapeptide repeat-containing protein [Dietzia cercidiphylli]|uniref:Pentapeptide repeat-containing protein n=1 Tax=Dietzia cercidiphylli TaxID=498199 RepID=A0ABN2J580_9ACTN|nr:pentapeptide repeat-containing protein [Dietzia cercidiphylli]